MYHRPTRRPARRTQLVVKNDLWVPAHPVWGRRLGAAIDIDDPEAYALVIDRLGPFGQMEVAPQAARIRLAEPGMRLARRDVVISVERGDIGALYAASIRVSPSGMATTSDLGHLYTIVETVMAGVSALGPLAALALRGARNLNSREVKILGLVAEGLTNRMVAERLSMSQATVKRDLETLLAALECTSRKQLSATARRVGLLGAVEE